MRWGPGLPPGGTFADDNGNTHEGMIEAIAEDGVTKGCIPEGYLYCPADNVTRGQMASFLARAFDLPASPTDFFKDNDGTTHEDNINRIANAGITLGFPDGTYQPLGLVSREQMGSFIARAMGLAPIPGNVFLDVSGTHEGNINAIADAEVTLGCNPEGTLYCPFENVRRDQMASFLGRALGLAANVPPPDILVSYGPGEPIVIGQAAGLGGIGASQHNSVKIAVADRAFILGHPVELHFEDSSCSPGGGTSAANALIGDPAVAAVVGTTCSVAAFTAAPIITDAGYTMISPSSTHPNLTEPGIHEAGYLRTVFNDGEPGAVVGVYAYNALGATTSAVIRGDDEYRAGIAAHFTEAFTGLGGANQATQVLGDIGSALDGVIAAGPPDVPFVATNGSTAADVVVAATGRPALNGTILLAGDSAFSANFLTDAGGSAEGMYVGAPPSTVSGPLYDAFEADYLATFGETPPNPLFDALSADAANMIMDAIEAIGTNKGGTLTFGRHGLRNALFATTSKPGIAGTITCDDNGDCWTRDMDVWLVQGGAFVAAP